MRQNDNLAAPINFILLVAVAITSVLLFDKNNNKKAVQKRNEHDLLYQKYVEQVKPTEGTKMFKYKVLDTYWLYFPKAKITIKGLFKADSTVISNANGEFVLGIPTDKLYTSPKCTVVDEQKQTKMTDGPFPIDLYHSPSYIIIH